MAGDHHHGQHAAGIQRHREEMPLETNFDEDGFVITRVHSRNGRSNLLAENGDGTGGGRSVLGGRGGGGKFHRSDMTIDRFEEASLHGNGYKASCCQSCMARIPYATLIATVMCLIGVAVFCGTMYRGASLTIIMFDTVFNFRLLWIEAVQMIFVVIGASMAALGFMILFVGCLATGSTRYKVYRAWRSRVGGRISCAVFMGITYVLNIVWILMLCFLVIITFVYTVFWNLCAAVSVETNTACIDLTQFRFMFPANTREEHMKVCEKYEVKAFCKDGVEKAEVMFILATVSCVLVILSLVHYLMCLSANYAHIRDHEKFQELQEIQNLNEMEYEAGSKMRF